jgi:hypothetical protein
MPASMETRVNSHLVAALLCTLGLLACTEPPHGHAAGAHPAGAQPTGTSAAPADTRTPVRFPEPLRSHTLANMRDHLLALAQIQDSLAQGNFDRAAEIAEQRLGMSSLSLHGAHDVARFMPPGMQEAGTAMHRAASRFATAAKDASVTGDYKSLLGALAQVNQTCVACHAGFRLEDDAASARR